MRETPLPGQQGGENEAAVGRLYRELLYPDLDTRVMGYDPLRLADAVFWLAHGDGGRPLLSRQTLELALAAGLLAELALARKIYLRAGATSELPGLVGICYQAPPAAVAEYEYAREAPVDDVSKYVYDQIYLDPDRDLQDWLMVLRTVSLAKVRDRLNLPSSPKVSRLRPSALPRAPTGRRADEPWAALTMRLRRQQVLSIADAVLVGLCLAVGLRRHLLEGTLEPARIHVEQAVAALPDDLAQIVAQTDAAVAHGAVKPRP